MDWITTFIILGCNVLTVLICRYAYPVRNEYKDGMILWTHIPAWAVQRKEVQDHVEQSQKQWKWYHRVGFIFGVGICLLGAISLELSIIVWIVWITVYIAGCYILLVKIYRKMLRIKKENQWYDEKTMRIRLVQNPEENGFIPRYMDDDDYWKNGWYSNPNDKRLIVQDWACSFNYTTNMARPAGKISFAAGIVITIVCLLWVCVLMFRIDFTPIKVSVGSDKIEITSGYSDMEIDIDEVQSAELLPKLPNDEYKRVNGSDDGQKKIGKFRGKKTGKCRMYIYVECTPILQINTSDEIIFINSKEKGAAEKWYEKIVQ